MYLKKSYNMWIWALYEIGHLLWKLIDLLRRFYDAYVCVIEEKLQHVNMSSVWVWTPVETNIIDLLRQFFNTTRM